MAQARSTSTKQADRKSKPAAKSTSRAMKDLAAKDAAKVKGGAKRRIVPCV